MAPLPRRAAAPLALLALLLRAAAAAAQGAPPVGGGPLWGPLNPGAATAGTAVELLRAMESGVGSITLTGARWLARDPAAPAAGGGCLPDETRAARPSSRSQRHADARGPGGRPDAHLPP